MKQLKDCQVSPDGSTLTYRLEDGSEVVKNFGVAIPPFSHPDPVMHCVFAMSAAVLALTERIEALERQVKEFSTTKGDLK